MIGTIFQFGNEVVEVRVNGGEVLFRTQATGSMFAPIEGLTLNEKGVVKEHPDLEGNPEWRKEAIKRFKEKIRAMDNENDVADYLVSDLKRHGYIPKYRRAPGFRRSTL